MALTLYELVGARDARFSPFCWRARLALAHKGLHADMVACRFTDKARIAFSGQEKVPVLVDGDTVVPDSWDIACYLESAYPDRPSLFGAEAARPLSRFIHTWDDRRLKPALLRLIVRDVYERVHPDDREYFRRTREQRYGQSLEALHASREDFLPELRKSLIPLRAVLEAQPYLSGDAPAYADYAVSGTFQWLRMTSPLNILEADDAIARWRERMLDLFDGAQRAHAAAA